MTAAGAVDGVTVPRGSVASTVIVAFPGGASWSFAGAAVMLSVTVVVPVANPGAKYSPKLSMSNLPPVWVAGHVGQLAFQITLWSVEPITVAVNCKLAP